jgi:hypothetical protein
MWKGVGFSNIYCDDIETTSEKESVCVGTSNCKLDVKEGKMSRN